jgi:hypothetical protein
MDERFTAGSTFVMRQARLLERRLFDTCFFGAPAAGVVDALRGYQNGDGGFGHALEPDTRCPASLPIDVEIAFKALAAAGTCDMTMVVRACDFLTRIAAEAGADGAVPLASPVIEAYPRADHMTDWAYEPNLNPTAGLVGVLHQLGVEHPWVRQAEAYCWAQLDSGSPVDDVHTLSEVLIFLAHVPERDRAAEYAEGLAGQLGSTRMLHLDPDAAGYGLTPLHLAPTAGSPWRTLFSDAQIDAHLDSLAAAQQSDGGWAITWEPPSEASALEWRGIVTLDALRTLTSYGRLDASR